MPKNSSNPTVRLSFFIPSISFGCCTPAESRSNTRTVPCHVVITRASTAFGHALRLAPTGRAPRSFLYSAPRLQTLLLRLQPNHADFGYSAAPTRCFGSSRWLPPSASPVASNSQMTATPNRALQRTRLRVTACVSPNLPTTDSLTTPTALQFTPDRLRPHRLCRPPQSLSLGSLVDL